MPRLLMAGLSIPAEVTEWGDAAASVTARQSVAQAFTELRQPVCRYLLALGLAPAEAEEVVQETFLRLCQHLEANGSRANLRGWIFRVAHNLARDEHRRRRRQAWEPLEDGNMHASADPGVTPEQKLIAEERTRRLVTALGRLPIHQQHCMHLRAEGLRYREIAEVLGASVSTVGEWVQQALKTLAKECNEKPLE